MASYRKTRDKRLLMDLSDIFPSPIIISDGAHANVVPEGTTTLGQAMEPASYFKIIGYPEWWNTGRGNEKSAGKGKGIVGARKGTLGVANVSKSGTTSFSASPVLTTQYRSVIGPNFTEDQ
ncbi:hypothetical protein KIW84_030082 [Lathyrus oleraceus]|uniref:Uncharacterized protein n=1 Tax=Pisum sativum TaxID=3888 RepID=A0A9D4XRD7_PEA|nr:hypothetical protein KIW84_030082 [Pisum sativum]